MACVAASDCYVEATYPYESTNGRGHSVLVQPGETYYLVREVDDDWWFVGRNSNDDDGFYFPRTYGKVVQQRQNLSNVSSSLERRESATSRLSTFGGGYKRRSYQIATSSYGPNSGDTKNDILVTVGGGGDSASSAAEGNTAAGGSSLMRRKTRNPGFKLADPDRISRSIPVDLNFVHQLPTNGDDEAGGIFVPCVSSHADAEIFEAKIEPPSTKIEQQTILTEANDEETKELTSMEAVNIVKSAFADGHIYANVKPVSAKELPPLPVAGSNPIRLLHDGWGEYVDKNNRHYFYNPNSRKASWKPPRTGTGANGGKDGTAFNCSVSSGDDLDGSFMSEDGDGGVFISSDILSSDGPSPIAPENFNGHSLGPALKPTNELENLNVGAAEGVQDRPWEHKEKSSSTMNRSYPGADYSQRDSDNFADSVLSSTSSQQPADYLKSLASFDRAQNVGNSQSQAFIRFGVLHRCKYMEAGKRLKKQWLSCFAYLTNAHLIFYKDEKSAEKKGNQYSTPLGVCDLRGAKIRWLDGEDISKRKNVFQLELCEETVYLFHGENHVEINNWFEDLRQVISQLPMPDFYPTPTIDSNSPTRFSVRKTFSSSNACAAISKTAAAAPELPKTGRPPTGQKDKDKEKEKEKRKSVSFTQMVPPSLAVGDALELLPKESILEKLRKFFRSRPTVESLKERGIYKAEPVFGSSLTDICRRENTTIPKFILTCTALIEEKGVEADGLYRINGNLSQVQRIRCQVDQEKYNVLLNETDIHVLTGALKLFFRELQEPAFPLTLTKDFLSAIKIQNPKQRLKTFSDLIPKLPRPHHDTLNYLFQHLLNVAKHASSNRMQIHNLAIVFGPTLFSSNAVHAKPTTDQSRTKSKKEKRPNDKSATGNGMNGNEKMAGADITHSNSQLAFTMILQGQIVEYMLKEHAKLFQTTSVGE